MKHLTLLVTLPLTVFAVCFAVANESDAVVRFYPGDAGFSAPVHTLGLAMMGIGFLAGAVMMFIMAQTTRYDLFKSERKAAQLEKELEKYHAAERAAADDAAAEAEAARIKRLPPPLTQTGT